MSATIAEQKLLNALYSADDEYEVRHRSLTPLDDFWYFLKEDVDHNPPLENLDLFSVEVPYIEDLRPFVLRGPLPRTNHQEAQLIASSLRESLLSAGWDPSTQIVQERSRAMGTQGIRIDVVLSAFPGAPVASMDVKRLKIKVGQCGVFQGKVAHLCAAIAYDDTEFENFDLLTQMAIYPVSIDVPFFIVTDTENSILIDTTGLLPPWIATDGNFFSPQELVEKYQRWYQKSLRYTDPYIKLSASHPTRDLRGVPLTQQDIDWANQENAILVINSDSVLGVPRKTFSGLKRLLSNGRIVIMNSIGPMRKKARSLTGPLDIWWHREAALKFPSPVRRDLYSEKDILFHYIYPAIEEAGWSLNLEEDAEGYALVEYRMGSPNPADIILMVPTENGFVAAAVIEAKRPFRDKRSNFRDIANPRTAGDQKNWRQVLGYAEALNAPIAYLTRGDGFFEVYLKDEDLGGVEFRPLSELLTPEAAHDILELEGFGALNLSAHMAQTPGSVYENAFEGVHEKIFAQNASFIIGSLKARLPLADFAEKVFEESMTNSSPFYSLPIEAAHEINRTMVPEITLVVLHLLQDQNWDVYATKDKDFDLLLWLGGFLTLGQLLGRSNRALSETSNNPLKLKNIEALRSSALLVILSSICRVITSTKSYEAVPLITDLQMNKIRESLIEHVPLSNQVPQYPSPLQRKEFRNLLDCIMD